MRFVEMNWKEKEVLNRMNCSRFCCSVIHQPVSASQVRSQQMFGMKIMRFLCSAPFHGMGYAFWMRAQDNSECRSIRSLFDCCVEPQRTKYSSFCRPKMAEKEANIVFAFVCWTEDNQLPIFTKYVFFQLHVATFDQWIFGWTCLLAFAISFTRFYAHDKRERITTNSSLFSFYFS